MGLESATYVNDLVSTNPLGTDVIPQGDDHLRLIKSALRATFKNFSAAFYYPATSASQVADVTVATTDQNRLFTVDCSGGAITVNLPQGSTIVDGFEIEVVKTDHSLNLLTVDGYSAETINGSTTQVLWQTYQSAKFRYSSVLSAWIMNRVYIPPKGEITPWIGAAALPTSGGFLYPNGLTIGDGSSAGTARANADCEGLFKLLWAEYSDTFCPVSTGRGGSAAADWTAHKRIGLPNLAGQTWVGLDNLGGISDRGLLTATADGANTAGQINGQAMGNESCLLTTSHLPASGLSFSGLTSGQTSDHTHSYTHSAFNLTASGGTTGGSLMGASTAATTGFTSSDHAHTYSGTTGNMGSGGVHANIQPSFVSAWKIKL